MDNKSIFHICIYTIYLNPTFYGHTNYFKTVDLSVNLSISISEKNTINFKSKFYTVTNFKLTQYFFLSFLFQVPWSEN